MTSYLLERYQTTRVKGVSAITSFYGKPFGTFIAVTTRARNSAAFQQGVPLLPGSTSCEISLSKRSGRGRVGENRGYNVYLKFLSLVVFGVTVNIGSSRMGQLVDSMVRLEEYEDVR